MPLYEYKCKACDCVWEESHKMDDRLIPTTEPCEECGCMEVILMVGSKVGDPYILGVTGPTSSFKDLMGEMQKAHPYSKLDRWKK